MSYHLPRTPITLSEPNPYERSQSNDSSFRSGSRNSEQENAWLREQLLAGKNSPLCDPITEKHFDELRSRVRRTFANKNQ
jgi:hypothetical protein